MQYQNPIIKGFYPDPSICRVGKDYYLVNSSFEYLPGIPIFHSTDLFNWKQIGYGISRASQMEFEGCNPNGGIFAPTIRYHEGIFYITSTNVSRPGAFSPNGSGNFIITAKDPWGEWSDPIWITQGGIDPSIFFDEDDRAYFTSTKNVTGEDGVFRSAIQMSEIDITTGKLLTESKVISEGCGGRFPEGPHIYKKDGYYYLILAEGGTEMGHRATISRSKNIWGAYESCPHNPILTAMNENDPSISALGHADLVETEDGKWWIVFLCQRLTEQYYHHLGRETGIAPMEWVDGWPVVYGGKVPTDEMKVEGMPQVPIVRETNIHTTFHESKLGLEWNFLRTFYQDYQLNEEKLIVTGNQYSLNDNATPAFIGRRQQDFECRMELSLSFQPEEEQEEAGIAIMHMGHGHYEMVLTRRGNQKVVLLRKTVFDMVTETVSEPVLVDELQLKIIADRYNYEFYYGIKDSYALLGTAKVKLLSSEVIGGCIGVFAGIYASGNGKACTSSAQVSWFDYEVLPVKLQKE
jgi:alpha-N-arabinofuranosidase